MAQIPTDSAFAGSIQLSTRSMSLEVKHPTADRSPRFMSATVLSASKQTPKNVMTGKETWMTSAAKRVGLRQISSGAPRARKEIPKRQTSAAFPNKVPQSM